MLKKIFFTEKRTEPISYEEFSAIGMSKAGYISYIAHCDRLRSALVLCYYADRGILSSKIKKRRDSINDICQICLDELLRVLQCFCDDSINLADLAREQISVTSLLYGMSYNGSMEVFLGKDTASPALLYVDFDCFRIYIETILYKLVNHIFPVFSIAVDPDIDDMDLNTLRIKAEQKRDYECYDSEPQFPTKSGKTSDIFKWAEKAERYYNHQCFFQEFEGIEETLARKEALVFDVHKHTLYIFNGYLSCRLKEHALEPTKAIIELPGIFVHRAELDILYCHECEKFFISETKSEK